MTQEEVMRRVAEIKKKRDCDLQGLSMLIAVHQAEIQNLSSNRQEVRKSYGALIQGVQSQVTPASREKKALCAAHNLRRSFKGVLCEKSLRDTLNREQATVQFTQVSDGVRFEIFIPYKEEEK